MEYQTEIEISERLQKAINEIEEICKKYDVVLEAKLNVKPVEVGSLEIKK